TVIDGWLHTGDLVERDGSGYFRVIDRIKDVFITGGETVAPAEIEAVLLEHPAVAEACVVGVPDETWGEVPVAWIVPARGALVDDDEVIAHCAASLARFKVPTQLRLVPQLPRTSNSKVKRRELLDRWLAEHIPTEGAR
ncbi:long-chain fatty acid--CoA ligase, partial [Schumannella luteola]